MIFDLQIYYCIVNCLPIFNNVNSHMHTNDIPLFVNPQQRKSAQQQFIIIKLLK